MSRDLEDIWELQRTVVRLDDACDSALEVLRRVEPTINDQLLRFDVRKVIDELEEAAK